MKTAAFTEPTDGFVRQFVMDLIGCAAIIAVMGAVLLQHEEVIRFKAKSPEIMLELEIHRIEVTEQYAHTGFLPRDTAEASVIRVITKEVKPAEPGPYFTKVEAKSGRTDGPTAESRAPERVTIAVSDAGIAASGTLNGREFTLGMRPAVAGVAEDWSIVWLCGEREPPAGWVAPPIAGPTKLPATFVPSVCRSMAPR